MANDAYMNIPLDIKDPEPLMVNKATTLRLDQQIVWATAIGTNYDIILPPVSQAVGRVYIIHAINDAVGTITVKSRSDDNSGSPYASGALTAAGDYVILISDGRRWFELAEVTT